MKTKLHLSLFLTNHVSGTFFRSTLMAAVVLLVALGGIKLLVPFSSSAKQNRQGSSGQQKIAQISQGRGSCPTCSQQQRMIYAPLFDLPESSRSEIGLNCRSAHDMVLTPTFYTLEGEAYTGDDITLKPNEIRFVDTKSLIPKNERNRHKWGGMAFSYVGGFMEAWAQLTLHGIRGGGSINVLFTVLSQKRSNTAEAVWWTPRGGSAVIALGNSSDQPVRANLTFASGESQFVDVRPFATEIVRFNSIIRGSTASGRVGAVSINYIGPEGSLIPTGYTSSANGRFASMIRFYDSRQIVQQHLYANNIRIKHTMPHMVLRNASTDFITATPTFLPPSGDADQSVKLPPIQLAPSEVVEVDLDPLLKAASNRSDLDSVSVQVSNTGNAGSLIGALYGFNTRIGVTYDVPLRDSGPPRASTGGYSVRFDGDYTTVVAISNTTDQPGEFTMQINHDGRPYVTGIIPVAPGATKTFDIRKLRDEQKPDINGHPLPPDLKMAQVRWSVRGKVRLNGRAEVVSVKDRVSSSYSCFLCCGYSFAGGFITPFGATVAPGATVGFTSWERATISGGQSCGSDPEPYPVGGFWESDTESVATMDGSGTATAISGGYAGIFCSWTAYINEYDDIDQSCEQTEVMAEAETNMVVVSVIIKQDGTDITNTTRDIVVGQKVSLTAQVDSGGEAISNPNWTIPGNKIKNYVRDAAGEGKDIALTDQDLSQPSINFYWVDGANGRQVVYSVTVNNQAFTGKATFNVKAPTNVMVSVTANGAIAVDSTKGPLQLHYGNAATPGIEFALDNIDTPVGVGYSTYWAQVVTSTLRRRQLTSDSTWQRLEATNVLDSQFPYDTNPDGTNDSPGVNLDSTYLRNSVNDSFDMWLMFEPDGTGSIPIPLVKISWSWRGAATRNTTTNTWSLDSGSAGKSNSSPANTMTFPKWSGNIANKSYVPEQ